MKLIIGLGNPDKKYQNTRHNLGKKIIKDFVEKQLGGSFLSKANLLAETYETGQGTSKNIFAIPTEYMNNSGLTVQKIAQFYKISPNDIYVIHDDLDLPIGEYKIQFDRGPAGHNGIKSIIENLNTQQFNRLRIGISKPQNNVPVEDYVLQPLLKEETIIIKDIIPKIFDDLRSIINDLKSN
jgi:PTH1 family peptidyl-tRNA hydrolase